MDLYIACPMLSPVLRIVAAPCETVLSLKLRLQLLIHGLPASQQRLLWRSCELANDSRLADCGLESGSTLSLLPRLQSGPASYQHQHQQRLAAQAAAAAAATSTASTAPCWCRWWCVYYIRPGCGFVPLVGGGSGDCSGEPVKAGQGDDDSPLSDKPQEVEAATVEVAATDGKVGGGVGRCATCRKRLTASDAFFACRCGGAFCARHRLPESHACRFDYRAEGQRRLAETLQPLRGAKIQRI